MAIMGLYKCMSHFVVRHPFWHNNYEPIKRPINHNGYMTERFDFMSLPMKSFNSLYFHNKFCFLFFFGMA